LNRVVREAKEKRRRLAQRKTAQPPKVNESVRDVVEAKTETETETEKESLGSGGMLPSDIVQLLAAREKYDTPLSLTLSLSLSLSLSLKRKRAHTHKHMNEDRNRCLLSPRTGF
jgi:hypothetical protein